MRLARLAELAVAGISFNVGAARLAAVFVLTLPLMHGCAGPDDDGIGGTGIFAQDSGYSSGQDAVDHSWRLASTDPDGIGGTGIIGEIAALGMADGAMVNQLHVAGLTLHIDNDTTVRHALQRLQSGALAHGQIVAVLAHQRGSQFIARDIRVLNALVGEVTRNDEGHFAVLGQQLAIASHATKFAPPFASWRSIRVGDRLRVSGLWHPSGNLLVTRVAPASAREPDALFAPLSAVRDQRLVVGALQIRSRRRLDARVGDYIEASGSATGLVLQASRVRMAAAELFPGGLAQVIVDGFAGDEGRRVGAIRTALPDSTRLRARIAGAEREGQRVIAGLEIRNGAAQIRRLRPLVRRRALRDPLPIPRMMPKQPPSQALPKRAPEQSPGQSPGQSPAQSSALPGDEAPAQNARPIQRRSAVPDGSFVPQPLPRVVPAPPVVDGLKRPIVLQSPLKSLQGVDAPPGDISPRPATARPLTRGATQ